MNAARAEILRRIERALHDVPADAAADEASVPRDYRHADSAPREELVAHFAQRVAEYKASVRVVVPAELPGAIAAACAAYGVRRLVVPAGLPPEWLPTGVELREDPGLTDEQLDTSDGVLTGCAIGIAQTGTIVLDSGAGQGRRAITLLPDYHLCVVQAGQIVGLVPEAIAHLVATPGATRRPVTFISGPSATSDIELSRVEGVHGPRTLEVLIVMP